MSTYNFDKVIDRRGTGALKLEALQPRYGDAHLLPLWVADMDFETPHFITDALRRRFYRWLSANELDEPTLFAPIATIAAYRYGEPWRRAMLRYVEANIDYLIDYCARHLPAIHPLRPEASFLVWLDCRGLKLDHDALINLFVRRAHLALNDGEMFGPGGEGYMRINVGTPRAILSEALERLRCAVNGQ